MRSENRESRSVPLTATLVILLHHRTSFLIEYLSVATYFNDHSYCWDTEDESTKEQCGGAMPVGPNGDEQGEDCVESENVGDGNCYFVDSTHSNSWR